VTFGYSERGREKDILRDHLLKTDKLAFDVDNIKRNTSQEKLLNFISEYAKNCFTFSSFLLAGFA
jgi:hypothetical protein